MGLDNRNAVPSQKFQFQIIYELSLLQRDLFIRNSNTFILFKTFAYLFLLPPSLNVYFAAIIYHPVLNVNRAKAIFFAKEQLVIHEGLRVLLARRLK